jgi:AGCS family alanine or glycine:cation symporter
VVNISAIMLLTPTIVNLTRDYQMKLKINNKPEFKLADVKIQGKTEDGVWS